MAPRRLPVFPLPDIVFYPGTTLPLHVFEHRYRAMVKDLLASDDRMIAVALLQPGWEETYDGSPAYHPIATAGRMDDIEQTVDGRFYFKLKGLMRVRLGQVVSSTPYRLVEAEDAPEHAIDESAPAIRRAKLDLLASRVCLARELAGSEHPPLLVDERISFEAAVNTACACLPSEPSVRQALLELDDLLERHRRAAKALDALVERVITLKAATVSMSETN